MRFCIFQKFSDDIEIKKSSHYLTNIISPFAAVGNKYDQHAHAKMGGTRFRIPPTSRGFWLRRAARRPANKMGRRPSTSAENFRRTRRDICPTSRELGWGTNPDVQRKCAPTSRENVPRRPKEMCPDVQRESTNVLLYFTERVTLRSLVRAL